MRRFLKLSVTVFCLPLLFSGCAQPTSPNLHYIKAEQNYAVKDYSRAFQELWLPAQYGQPRAMYAMGYMYYNGIGTNKDQDIGRSLIRRAAEQHYPPAILALKRIDQERREQYLPLEQYDAKTQEEGFWAVPNPRKLKGVQ